MPYSFEGRAAGFNPAVFIGKGWRFAGVPTSARIRGVGDVQRVTLFSALRSGEEFVTGEETLRRLTSEGKVTLGAEDFHFFWTRQSLIPEEWKKFGAVFFDGDPLLDPDDRRCTLYLGWNGECWFWIVYWLGLDRFSVNSSVVLT